MDLWIANEGSLQQANTPSLPIEAPLETNYPVEVPLKIKPFVLEGSVETFNPISRAKEIAKTN